MHSFHQHWHSSEAQTRLPVDSVPDLGAYWFRPTEGARVLSGGGSDAEWTGAPLTYTDAEDAASAPPAILPLAVDGGQQPPASSASPQNLPATEVTPQNLHHFTSSVKKKQKKKLGIVLGFLFNQLDKQINWLAYLTSGQFVF